MDEKVRQMIDELKFHGQGESYSAEGRRNPIRDDTGLALSAVTATALDGACVEIGTAYGLSMLWLYAGDPTREYHTCEFDRPTAVAAKDNFRRAGINVNVYTDTYRFLSDWKGRIAVLFLDHEKRLYLPHYEMAKPHIVRGGVVVADNVLDRAEECAEFVRVMQETAWRCTILPTECGLLIARF